MLSSPLHLRNDGNIFQTMRQQTEDSRELGEGERFGSQVLKAVFYYFGCSTAGSLLN